VNHGPHQQCASLHPPGALTGSGGSTGHGPLVRRVPGSSRCVNESRSDISLLDMATFRSAAALLSADGTRTPGTVALFTEPSRGGKIPPWAGDFRPATDSRSPKDAVGRTFTLEMPDGRTGKVVIQSSKVGKNGMTLALLGEDSAPF
jgi:hypothetical protein